MCKSSSFLWKQFYYEFWVILLLCLHFSQFPRPNFASDYFKFSLTMTDLKLITHHHGVIPSCFNRYHKFFDHSDSNKCLTTAEYMKELTSPNRYLCFYFNPENFEISLIKERVEAGEFLFLLSICESVSCLQIFHWQKIELLELIIIFM